MYKIEVELSKELDEKTYKTKLKNGLEILICKKEGFDRKIGMFGTKYGSIYNEFYDIVENKRIKVPDGIAHFLEHKLFEKEGDNALDMFAKMGVSSNAYTSYDQTVYYFDTNHDFTECISKLVTLIKEPYFTDDNVNKEQGIIAQEIQMYNDEPSYRVYFNCLDAMYNNSTVKIDVAGTIESISHITKEMLYTCYNTFYSPQNMFFIVVGDVDIESTISLIEENIRKYEKNYDSKEKYADINKYLEEEDIKINKKEIVENSDVQLPIMCIGYKLKLTNSKEILKNQLICDVINSMYFSKGSEFYEMEYQKGLVSDDIFFSYEGGENFSHVIISANTTSPNELSNDIVEYIEHLKISEIDKQIFDRVKKKKIGELIISADNLTSSYRRLIDSVINGVDVYLDVNLQKSLEISDIRTFLDKLDKNNQVLSLIMSKKDSN